MAGFSFNGSRRHRRVRCLRALVRTPLTARSRIASGSSVCRRPAAAEEQPRSPASCANGKLCAARSHADRLGQQLEAACVRGGSAMAASTRGPRAVRTAAGRRRRPARGARSGAGGRGPAAGSTGRRARRRSAPCAPRDRRSRASDLPARRVGEPHRRFKSSGSTSSSPASSTAGIGLEQRRRLRRQRCRRA